MVAAWAEVVRGMLPEAGEIIELNRDEVVARGRGGYVTISFGGRNGRAWGLGHGMLRTTSRRDARYTGQGWHRRLVHDAWKALVEVEGSAAHPTG